MKCSGSECGQCPAVHLVITLFISVLLYVVKRTVLRVAGCCEHFVGESRTLNMEVVAGMTMGGRGGSFKFVLRHKRPSEP
jgi:hypothetical protein